VSSEEITNEINTATNMRLIVAKAVLWFLLGIAAVVAVVRYAVGLGATTALTDTTPWGMWIGFDVMAGVALAAGGFVIAATVYIFGRDRYHHISRPAILTAFLGYLAVICGLLVDLGRPWNIWRMIVNWNPHSPLFEVGVCVMLYTTVLALEFAPVVLERFPWARTTVKILRKLTLPIVIVGIALSTLHQSSLGTLFLLQEGRMHPLWFTPILPALFLISAIGLGLGMVTFEGLVTSWLYKRQAEWSQFRGLTRAAAIVLSIYLAARLIDLAVRGNLGYAFDGSWWSILFWIEITMSAVAPILLFSLPHSRGRPWAISWGAVLIVAGFILHRADVGGISHMAVTGEAYVPALSELAISLGVVSLMAVIFLFFVEHLHVWEEKPAAGGTFTKPAFDPLTSMFIGSPWFGGGQRATLAWIVGAVCGLILMEGTLAWRAEPTASPLQPPRTVQATATAIGQTSGHLFRLASADGQSLVQGQEVQKALLIDSGGAGRFVLFPHGAHQKRLGEESSCNQCHHRNVPLDNGTSCVRCHQDMYRTTDTFNHARHVKAHGQEQSCAVCHPDPRAVKDRFGSKACDSCHQPIGQSVAFRTMSPDLVPGMAPGYMTAMHGMCIACHQRTELEASREEPYLTLCTTCHRGEFADEIELRRGTGWPAAAMVSR
jgi:Ni/Fe-hydrogenase subunit HybB-like protein